MDNISVKLMQNGSLDVVSYAIRTCKDSHDKSDNGGEKDRKLIYEVGNRQQHSSTLEHCYYTFFIKGISRALLQELARHRIASLSVKSTRFTLNELKYADTFFTGDFASDIENAKKYIVLTGNISVDSFSMDQLEKLRILKSDGVPNDKAKYALPDAYRTELVWTINARSLQNFLKLRTHKSALYEIRLLANMIFDRLPDDHKYLFEDFLNK